MSRLYKLPHITANPAKPNHSFMKDLGLHFQFVLSTLLEFIVVSGLPGTHKTPKLPPVLYFDILF